MAADSHIPPQMRQAQSRRAAVSSQRPPAPPPVISNGIGQCFLFPIRSCESVGLYREKSLCSWTEAPPSTNSAPSLIFAMNLLFPLSFFCHPERSEGSAFALDVSSVG